MNYKLQNTVYFCTLEIRQRNNNIDVLFVENNQASERISHIKYTNRYSLYTYMCVSIYMCVYFHYAHKFCVCVQADT